MRWFLHYFLLPGMLLSLVLPAFGEENLAVSRRILLPDGKPAAGAKVTIRTIGTGGIMLQELETKAGADGMVSATVRYQPPEQSGSPEDAVSTGYMMVDVPGCALAFGRITGFTPHIATDKVIPNAGALRLASAYVQTGQVIERGTGNPLASALVIVVSLLDSVPANVYWAKYVTRVLSASTDKNGQFKLRGMTAESLEGAGAPSTTGAVTAAVAACVKANNRLLGGETRSFTFSAAPGELQKIEVGPTAPLEGKVIDSATGDPVAGVKVRLVGMPPVWLTCIDASVTDARGMYRFAAVPEADRVYAIAAHSEYTGGWVQAYLGGGRLGNLDPLPEKIIAPDLTIRQLSPLTTFQVVDALTGKPPRASLRMSLTVDKGYLDDALGWIGQQVIFAPVQADGSVSVRLPVGQNKVSILGPGYKGEGLITVPTTEKITVTVRRVTE